MAYRFYGAFLAAKVAVLDDRGHARPPSARRRGLPSRPTSGAVRAPLRGDRRARAAGRAGAGGAVGLLPRLRLDRGRAPAWPARCTTSWSCGPRCARTACRCRSWPGAPSGRCPGSTASIATLFIVVVTLASVATVVVNALCESSLGHVHDHRHDPRGAAHRTVDVQDPAGPYRGGVGGRRDHRDAGRHLRQAVRRDRRWAATWSSAKTRLSIMLPITPPSPRSCRSGC